MTAPNPDRKPCGARTRSGQECSTWAMPNGRCRMHGGKSAIGQGHPRFTHGRYSKYLPRDVLDRVDAGQTDLDLISMREELVVLDALAIDGLLRLETGESGETWAKLKQAFREFQHARMTGAVDLMKEALERIESLIEAGDEDQHGREEFLHHIELRRQVVATQLKHWLASGSTVPADQVVAIISSLLESVRRHSREDPAIVAAVSRDAAVFLGAVGRTP
ncbi:MAG: hypothetical protein EPO65_05565 [Dehalococcoidia bacterium]|nr:MAG: hypothetical protein EPO65_05565 [Dehalococcoidia bacterium]